MFEIAYRIVAIVMCLWYSHIVWNGLEERKIALVNTDWLDWWTPTQIFHRDAAPVRYWIIMSMQAGSTVIFFIAAVVGWWQPNS